MRYSKVTKIWQNEFRDRYCTPMPTANQFRDNDIHLKYKKVYSKLRKQTLESYALYKLVKYNTKASTYDYFF